MNPIIEIKSLLETPHNIIIITHAKPDGDALGSLLGLYNFLKKEVDHTLLAVSPTDISQHFSWMPNFDEIANYENNPDIVDELLEKTDLIFCLDFNRCSRVEKAQEVLKNSKATKIMIDHHLDPENYDDYRLWEPEAISTTYLVYKFIDLLGKSYLIDTDIATCLYTGLVTDSGSFRFSGVDENVHLMAANLLKHNINHATIHQKIYDTFTENRLKFYGYCFSNKLEFLNDYNAAVMYVSAAELKKYDIENGDTEGLVNYPLSIKSVYITALFIEREDRIKLSLRSKANIPANKIAEKYFEGGGHLNAAGGVFYGSLEEAVDIYKKAIEEFKDVIVLE